MNLNATLIGQSITFLVFVWFCMKYIWPPLTRALEERRRKIADGLAAAERGRREQELAARRAAEVIHEAKEQAADIIARAERRAAEIVEEAKAEARAEGERILAAARSEIEQEIHRAREELRRQVAALAVAGAERILEREVDERAHARLLDELAARL